jgi:RHS repeat-associated protein
VFKVGGQKKEYNQNLRWWLGRLDEVSYWDRALSDAEVGDHHAALGDMDPSQYEFVYAGMALDAVSDGSFTYSRSPSGRLVAQTDGVTDSLIGLDRHGDVSWLMSPAGVVSDTRVYDPFGDVAAASGMSELTVGFQGDFTDPASGEVWMGARWYSAADAVFRSRDSVSGELVTPVSLNRYTYGWANPLRYWDPDGHSVLQGDGGPGTTEYYGVNNSTDYRKLMEIRALAAVKEAAGRAVDDFSGSIFDVLSLFVQPASAQTPTTIEYDFTLDGAALEEMTEFLEGHGALPNDWGEGTDRQRRQYFAWTTLASTGNTALSYQQWKQLEDAQWVGIWDERQEAAFKAVSKADCAGALVPWVCEHDAALKAAVIGTAVGMVTGGAAFGVVGAVSTMSGTASAAIAGGVGGASASAAGQYVATGTINPATVARDAIIGAATGAVLAKAASWWRARSAANSAQLANGTQYETLYEARISGTSRSAHRAAANRQLASEMGASPEFQGFFDETLGTDVLAHMRGGSGGLRNPPGTVWHHPAGNSDSVFLVQSEVHTNPALQSLLHPGPGGGGGFAEFFGGGQ